MTDLNEIIHSEKKSVKQIYDSFSKDGMYVDDTFQRRAVWVQRNKIRLIETILTGYPMPELYLWRQKSDPKTGKAKESIVDGQQRVNSLMEFIANEWPLKSTALDKQNRMKSFSGKKFNQLDENDRRAIWDYLINVRVVPSKISRKEIIAIFLRLNETDKSLNPQEFRNAEFNGAFIQNAERLADFDFWEKWKFFKPASIRRMGDIQFCSSLLIFMRQGLKEELNQNTINKAYDIYNDNYPEAPSDLKIIGSALKKIDQLFEMDSNVRKFFLNQVHFYPLLINMIGAKTKASDYGQLIKRMAKFVIDYGKKSGSKIKAYRLAATEGTQKRQNRLARVSIMKECLAL